MSKSFTVSAHEVTLAGLAWVEQYNCYRLKTKVAGFIDVTFSWDGTAPRGQSSGYKIAINGVGLKARGTDPSNAATIAVTALKALLVKATEEIGHA